MEQAYIKGCSCLYKVTLNIFYLYSTQKLDIDEDDHLVHICYLKKVTKVPNMTTYIKPNTTTYIKPKRVENSLVNFSEICAKMTPPPMTEDHALFIIMRF